MFSGLLNQAANKALAQEDTSEVDGPRRPTLRFEAQAADHKSSSRGGVAKLGLATTQGSVEGIKLYAATHAAKEENYRHVTELGVPIQYVIRRPSRPT